MATFLLRRLLALPPLLLAISFLTYLLLQAAPGDYFSMKELDPKVSQDSVMEMRVSAGKVERVSPERIAELVGEIPGGTSTYSFDAAGKLRKDGVPADPRNEQKWIGKFTARGDTWTVTALGNVFRWTGKFEGYFHWLSRVVRGDLGHSWSQKEDVSTLIGNRMKNTLLLEIVVLMLAWGIAVPLGVWSGVRPNSWVDHVCGGIAYVSLSVPSVFLALLALLLAYHTGWFPVGSMRDKVKWDTFSAWEKTRDVAWHLILPAAVVACTEIAGYMRRMRSQMVDAMSQDYVRTARSKGVSRTGVVYKHALRNAINPMVTLFGFSIAALLSGSFLVEVVMDWPGLAPLTVGAVLARDEPLVMASILMAAVLLVIGNLLADVLLALVDPRIRLE